MKGKMAGILLAGTMFAITGATLPASATVLRAYPKTSKII